MLSFKEKKKSQSLASVTVGWLWEPFLSEI